MDIMARNQRLGTQLITQLRFADEINILVSKRHV
jgi:hypothetical protein